MKKKPVFEKQQVMQSKNTETVFSCVTESPNYG